MNDDRAARAILTPQTLLYAYTRGAFPMTGPDGRTRWYTADPRGVFPLEPGAFHVPKSLRQTIRSGRFDVRVNADFQGTMRDCMTTPRRDDPDAEPGTWISDDLVAAYAELHRLGYAHSVEVWRTTRPTRRIGGLYGVAIGGAFFGESMYHHERDASKVALVALVERLRETGFTLLDTQACTPHLSRFGCVSIPAGEYLRRLRRAIRLERTFVDS